MSDFFEAWALSRGRFDSAVSGLRHDQLSWRIHPGALTIGEMAAHVAGVEVYFASQLKREEPEGLAARVAAAATDGVVNDRSFPFAPDELTPEGLDEILALGRAEIGPLIKAASPEIRARQITSALGPVIDGGGAFARLAFHAGYHQGQVHMVVTAPGFPA
jgi:hypothetical protein